MLYCLNKTLIITIICSTFKTIFILSMVQEFWTSADFWFNGCPKFLSYVQYSKLQFHPSPTAVPLLLKVEHLPTPAGESLLFFSIKSSSLLRHCLSWKIFTDNFPRTLHKRSMFILKKKFATPKYFDAHLLFLRHMQTFSAAVVLLSDLETECVHYTGPSSKNAEVYLAIYGNFTK